MLKILFLIHDLSVGGAEKVLVNLVNNMDQSKFDITVMSLFGGGVNEQFLGQGIHYHAVFNKTIPGNSKLMKLLTPQQLHRWLIKEQYDIEVSYLEGPCARIISGCQNKNTKLVSWIHGEMHTKEHGAKSFRCYAESANCYGKFDMTVCVSKNIQDDFLKIFPDIKDSIVLYNTNETTQIIEKSQEQVEDNVCIENEFKIVAVGKICKAKGVDRLAHIHNRLRNEGFNVHTYVLGVGDFQKEVEEYLFEYGLSESFTFLGYQTNPYKYVAKCDLFVCASLSEGFSTAATKALIVGTPVCTVDVSGMKEMLGENNEYGVVCKNDEDSLYHAIKQLIINQDDFAYYKQQAKERGKYFSTENTVKAVENMLERLCEK